jgi:hypothetical protein
MNKATFIRRTVLYRSYSAGTDQYMAKVADSLEQAAEQKEADMTNDPDAPSNSESPEHDYDAFILAVSAAVAVHIEELRGLLRKLLAVREAIYCDIVSVPGQEHVERGDCGLDNVDTAIRALESEVGVYVTGKEEG